MTHPQMIPAEMIISSPNAITRAGPDGSWILGTLERRRAERGLVHEQMHRIRDAYNGDMIVPLPEQIGRAHV